MKTPKRDIMPLFQLEGGHRLYKGKEHEYFKLGFFPATASRWKRKNRIRQLKATISRQKKEYERLWESFSHMSKRCCQLLYPNDEQP